MPVTPRRAPPYLLLGLSLSLLLHGAMAGLSYLPALARRTGVQYEARTTNIEKP